MKHVSLVLFFALFLFGFTACNKKNENNLIRIGVLNGPSAVSFVQLLNEEHVIDGRKIEIIVKNEPFQIQAMMIKNELDFAVLPTVMAVNLYNKGMKYRMVACPIWGTLYLLSSDEEVERLSDLENRDVSIFGQGGTADILLQHMLKQEQIKMKSFDYRFGTNNELAQALLLGKTKTAVISEPLASILLSKNPNIRIIQKLNYNSYINDSYRNTFIQSAFVVSEKFINNSSHSIQKVCEIYANSCNFVNENPEIAAKLMVFHKITPSSDIAKKSIELCNIRYVAASVLTEELYHYLHLFHLENPESIGGKMPGQDFIYETYNKKQSPEISNRS